MPLVRWATALALACIGLVTTPCLAAASNRDTIVLVNGDQVRGEIKGLEYAKLGVSTDGFGTVSVKWDHVVSVSSPAHFEAETATGALYYGSLAPGERPRMLIVVGAAQTVSLPFEVVVRLRPVKARLWERLDGSINLGASYASSSGVGQGTLNLTATAQRPMFAIATKLDATASVQASQRDQSRVEFELGYTRRLARRWFLIGKGNVEHNTELGLRLRSALAAGVGRDVVRTNRSVVAWSAGVQVNRERPLEGDTKGHTESFVSGSCTFFTYDSPKTRLSASFVAVPSLTVSGRVRTEFDASVSREVFKDFLIGFSLYDSVDNKPPTAQARTHDLGTSITVGWSF
jgi:hypothetical protein